MYVNTIFKPAKLDGKNILGLSLMMIIQSESVPVKALRHRNEELVKGWKKGEKQEGKKFFNILYEKLLFHNRKNLNSTHCITSCTKKLSS